MNNNRISTTAVQNKHTLQINNMIQDDFGSYTCFATNELGKNQRAIVLSGLQLWRFVYAVLHYSNLDQNCFIFTFYFLGQPTKPKVTIRMTDDGKSPEIKWTVQSYSPILEYELRYKRIDVSKKKHSNLEEFLGNIQNRTELTEICRLAEKPKDPNFGRGETISENFTRKCFALQASPQSSRYTRYFLKIRLLSKRDP